MSTLAGLVRSLRAHPQAIEVGCALLLAGCHGCRGDHPFVPYAIGPADAAAAASGAASGPPAAASGVTSEAGAFTQEVPLLAPPGLARWDLEGLPLQAPDGSVFVAALVRDFDGDGSADAFALARPAQGNDPGQLAFYRGATRQALAAGAALPPTATFAPPAGLARDDTCAPLDRLSSIGDRAVLVELGATCPQAVSSTPDRYVAVLGGGSDSEVRVRLAVTIADPPGSPALTVEGEVSDRDGDGRQDVALRITIEGGGAPLEPGPRVSGVLAWLDRSAGLSRDAGATEASFRTLASWATTRSVRAKDAPLVPRFVTQARALWRSICADDAMPRLVGVQGIGAIPCGASRSLEELGLAEVRAYVTMGDPLRAALALEHAQTPPASRTAPRTVEAQAWVAQLAPVAMARPVRAIAAVPSPARGHELSWGALAFEPSGKLLVRTAAGLVRVDPEQGDEASADGTSAWNPAVVSPDGVMRWIEAYDPCDGVALRATFASGDDVRDVALPVFPPLGNHCAGSRGSPAHAIPIAWGPGGLEAIVEDEPVLISADLAHASLLASVFDQAPPRGGPRSPDGRFLVLPTRAGFLVRSSAQAHLFRAPGFDGLYSEQRDCVVSSDGVHVACVHGGRAWVGGWDGS